MVLKTKSTFHKAKYFPHRTFQKCGDFLFWFQRARATKFFLFVVLKLFWWGQHFPLLHPKETSSFLKKWPLNLVVAYFVGNFSGTKIQSFKNKVVKMLIINFTLTGQETLSRELLDEILLFQMFFEVDFWNQVNFSFVLFVCFPMTN